MSGYTIWKNKYNMYKMYTFIDKSIFFFKFGNTHNIHSIPLYTDMVKLPIYRQTPVSMINAAVKNIARIHMYWDA